MAVSSDLAFAPAYKLKELIAQRKVSPVELSRLFLERIEKLNPKLNAFLTVVPDQAIKEAQAAEQAVMRGETLPPLHGIPTSIKDLVPTKDIRTTRGSLVYKDWLPNEDDIVVERIRKAGAIILGKTNTPEFGQSGTTENKLGDHCRNPWNPERTSGGSSGGAAAAIAAGLNPIAQGSDGGGSIRIPSSFCGIFGIKGTQGRVPRKGDSLLAWLPVNFSQIGPMTRTVRDAAVFLQVMAGPDKRDPGCIRDLPPDFTSELGKGVHGLRIVWSPDLGSAAVDPQVVQVTEEAVLTFAELGANVERDRFKVDAVHLSEVYRTIMYVNYWLNYGHLLDKHADQLMPYVRTNIENGRGVTSADYAKALAQLEQYRAYVRDFFTRYDLLITPTLALPAFPVGQRPKTIAGHAVDERMGFYPFTFPFNMAGNPAASIPCGFSKEGLPIGLHLVGRRYEEVTVFQAAAAFEEARPWANKRPSVS